MKSIKDLREQYDIITEKEESEERKLSALVRAGLYDAKKLPALKKALEKSADKMTGAEKRMLINLLDSLMSQVISNQSVYQKVKQNVQKINEVKNDPKIKVDYLSKLDPRFDKNYSEKNIPTVLILKRKAIRVYPDFQKVALYYAQAIDKYVSIPFGEINVGGLNEAITAASTPGQTPTSNPLPVQTNTLGSASNNVLRRNAKKNNKTRRKGTSGLQRWAYKKGLEHRRALMQWVRKIKGKNTSTLPSNAPSSAPSTAAPAAPSATPKTPKSASKNRRQSKKSTSNTKLNQPSPKRVAAKMAKNPNIQYSQGAINYARGTSVTENFQERVALLREQRQLEEGALQTADDFMRATGNMLGGKYVAAAGDYAVKNTIGRLFGGKGTTFKKELDQETEKSDAAAKRSPTATTAGHVAGTALGLVGAGRIAGRLGAGKWIARGLRGAGRVARGAGKLALAAAAGAAGAGSGGSGGSESSFRKPAEQGYQFGKVQATTADSFAQKNPTNDAQAQRDYQAQKKANQAMYTKESVLSQMQNMLKNDISSIDVLFENKSIMINNTVARKIVNLHESVNKNNKKKIEKMLNESASSFSKVLTFALRY